MPESILVVGGAGYIGSHTAKLLHQRGYKPVILDDLSTGHRKAALYGELVEGSSMDSDLVEKLLRKHKIATVMHFGAKALVGESLANPLLYYDANVTGTIRLLNAMLRCGVKKFIFSSTCATFGEAPEVPIHEGVEQHPINPYGQSKLMVEQILKDMHVTYGFHSGILRYFNAAGADPDGELGEDHDPETHLIPNVINAALGRIPKVTVFGGDYPTADGSCVRDYVHVDDLADAHIKAMELIHDSKKSFDFNLGSERGHSVLEVVKAVEKITGKAVPHEIGPRRHGDPPVLIADSAKARELLGWRHQHDLFVIVESAYNWMRKHPKGYDA